MRGVACLVWLCLATTIADAEPSADLFDQGVALKGEGKLDEACVRFEESFRLEPAPGTMLNIGDCAERGGDLSRALAMYVAAERAFTDAGSDARARFAHNRATTVQSRLQVTIAADRPPPPASTPSPHRRTFAKGFAIGGFALGALGIGVGGYELAVALRDDAAADHEDFFDARRLRHDAEDERARALVAGGIGLVGAAVGVTALIYLRRTRDDRPIAIVPVRSGAALAWSW